MRTDDWWGRPLGEDLVYWLYLTRREWQLAYILSAALMTEELIPPRYCGSLGQSMRYVVIYLAERGFDWSGIGVGRAGKMFAKGGVDEHPENTLWIDMLRQGGIPDYLTHAGPAAEELEEQLPDSLELDLVRHFHGAIIAADAQRKAMVSSLPPEAKQEMLERARALVEDKMRILAAELPVEVVH